MALDRGDAVTAARNYCRPECANPDYNECADCWKDGGNPALHQSPEDRERERWPAKTSAMGSASDSKEGVDGAPGTSTAYSDGDRCRTCLRWFGADGRWHIWWPQGWADRLELARQVTCPRCAARLIRDFRRQLATL